MKLSFSNSIFLKNNNNAKRDTTPIMSRNISTNAFVTSAIPQTDMDVIKRKIKKRNNRPGSFGNYNLTESSLSKDKTYMNIHKKSLQKKPLIVKLKQFNLSKIPFKSNVSNQTKMMYSTDNELHLNNNKNKDNLLINSNNFNNFINSNSICFSTKENMTCSEESARETCETKKRLQLIEEDITTLLQETTHHHNKQMILKELESMYKRLSKSASMSMKSISQCCDSMKEMEKNKEENEAIKIINMHLQNKMNIIESKFELMKKENDKMKEYVNKKVCVIDDIQMKVANFNKEIQKYQIHKVTDENSNKGKTNNDNDNKYNDNKNNDNDDKSINESLDSINLTSNQSNGNELAKVNNVKPKTQLALNLIQTKVDFNDEFLENYQNFSPSWRRETDKMLQRQMQKK